MKKIIYLFAFIGLVFTTACTPLDDINAEIDAQLNPIVGEATFTLSDDDYAELGLSYGSFSSLDDAKSALPGFLTAKYPIWGKGSSALVGYQLYVGSAPGVSDYTYADDYALANTNYPSASINAVGFLPNEDPSDFLANILAANVADPVEGQNILIKYKQYVGETVAGSSNYFETDFTDGTLGDFEAISVLGDQVWGASNYGAKMSGFSGGAIVNEDWLISPEIDLSTQTNLTFQTSLIMNYSTAVELVNVLVSTDFTTGGDPNAATWDVLNLTNVPDGTNWTPVLSEEYDFSAYEGETIHIAYKYESTESEAATWEIENLAIKTPGVEGETILHEVYYTYDGSTWEESTGIYILTADDYDAMGTASGTPGRYNNFDSSMDIDGYISIFLGIKYPFAQDDESLIIIYKYYSSTAGATQTRGNSYTVTDGAWLGYLSTISTTLQFGHDGNTWVPDNTIKYELTGADYQYIADVLEGNPDFSNVSLPNLASYGDFDYNWDDDQLVTALGLLASHINPGAAEGQKYTFVYLMYDNGLHTESMNLILTGGVWVLNI